ncbi:nuclear transport factor 2 family protein [Paractinoplanes lichenicola]|uniref:Nuclear transport factor 2 family protein n=1 Tax=Paractinoplanes lichenicola TaxID=2802976 RepID=A0ABS1VN73_9ACTN|nr:nuclear transport factor 2 family protein [Actinoplanes lichenicola]MBL7255921.1 nuclear transport factor 2 family protein [Actinoplanes lichenicola]
MPSEAHDLFHRLFTAKTARDVDATHAFFHPDRTFYADAALGWVWPTSEALRAVWAEYMPAWPDGARSYPTRILGDTTSAIVFMTDTPELFGGEIRAIAPIDFADGRIVRWIDYWDARNFGAAQAAGMRTPPEQYPDLYAALPARTPTRIDEVAAALHESLATGEPAALFAAEAVFEDLTLRTTIRGHAAIGRYFSRAAKSLPYGPGAQLRHVVGTDLGGGYEWQSTGPVPRGVTALELTPDAAIDRMTTVWDGALLPDDALLALAACAVDV